MTEDLTVLGVIGVVYLVNVLSLVAVTGGWALWYFLFRREK